MAPGASRSFLLNIPAGRMSLYADHPDDFVTWVREWGERLGWGDRREVGPECYFIANVRSVSTDPVLVRQNWLAAYDVATGRAALFLNEYAKANDPFGRIGTHSVSVQVTSVVRASGTSFQVKWAEQGFARGSLERSERWTAILTVVLRPPRTAESLRANPLGLFVTAIDWSRELDTVSPRPAPHATTETTP